MTTITIALSDETALALKVSEDGLGEEVRMAAAAKLYELGRLSSGAAANLAGIPRALFLARLGDYGVSTFQLTEDELTEDLAHA
jgi:predicted HTH domain antitoxin